MDDNFEFQLIGVNKLPFLGYISSIDKTKVAPNALIRGSKNVYRKINGNIATRPGLKTYGAIDATLAGTVANFDWYTSLGSIRPLRVNNNQLQAEWAGTGSPVWYNLNLDQTLLSPAATLTRFIIDSWWDNNAKKDISVMVNGGNTMMHWSGGIAQIASTTTSTITKSDSTKTWAQEGFSGDLSDLITAVAITAGGSSYAVGDILTIVQTIVASRPGIGGTITVTSVDGGGAVTGINLTTPGSNYGLGSGLATTGGLGTGATIQITGIAQAEMRLVINGVEYTCDGGTNSQTLTGVSPSPAAVPANSIAIQSVITDYGQFPAGFNADFLHVIGNRIHVGSYTSRLIYISDSNNYRNFVVPTPRTAGSAELLTLDETADGIGARQGVAWISAGLSDWYAINYSDLTVGTTATQRTDVVKYPGAINSAAYAQEFIDSSGDDIIFLAKDQQLRTVSTVKSIFAESRYPSLSLQVEKELKDENFTGGALKIIDDIIYITAPTTGRDWMYQVRTTIDDGGNIKNEQLWHPPQVRGISRFSVIGGITYGHSSANPMVYQVWDTLQWHDDSPYGQLPYVCVARLAYNSFGRPQGLWKFSRIFSSGYMSPGTNLYANVYYNYKGSTNIQQIVVNTTGNGAHFYMNNVNLSLGQNSLGDNPLGDGIVIDPLDEELVPKFMRINKVGLTNCFEESLEYFSIDNDCRWELVAIGVNATRADQEPTFLQIPVV